LIAGSALLLRPMRKPIMSKSSAKKSDPKAAPEYICRNRKASHEYEILDELECGIILRGSEVKSLRNHKMSIDEAFARIRDGELWLMGADIAEYPQANIMNHEPKRPRKLLLHKKELRKFADAAEERGFTLIPLAVYFSGGKVKVMIALAKGRKLHDKREKLRTATDKQEMRAAKLRRQ
jgi:SsrA-binding protein